MRHVFFFGLILLTSNSCNKNKTNIYPQIENITESVYASGVIKSENQYQVFATVNGLLNEVFVKEGDIVSKGQVLFSVFNEASKLSAENAELQAAYTDFGNNRQKLEELRVNLDLAKKKMHQDSLLWMRQEVLWKQDIGSKIELEQKELAYKSSLSNYKSAQLRLKDLEKQLKFSSLQSKKNLQISKRNEADFQIKSSFNGKVYSILKNEGELISTQSPIAVIGDAEKFLIELQIDEYDIARVRKGMLVYVHLDSYKDSVYEAQISTIYPIMNERSKTFTVEAVFTKRPPLLYPNLTVEANILLKSKRDALTIPRKYLMNDSFVMHTDGRKIRVVTGLKDYQKVEIVSGISSKDALVLPEE